MASQRESDATTQQQEGRISEESTAIHHHDIEQGGSGTGGGGLADGSGVDGEEDEGGPPLPLQQQFDERSDHEIKLAAAAAGVGATTVGPNNNITSSSEIIANTRDIEEDGDDHPPLPLQHLEGTASDLESKLSAAPQDTAASVAAAVAQSTVEQITDDSEELHTAFAAAPIPYQQQFEDHDASQKGAPKDDQHDDNEVDVAHDILQDDSAPIPLAQQRGIDDMNVDNDDDAELRDAKLPAKLQMANEAGGGEGGGEGGGSDDEDDERKPPAITSTAAVTSAATLSPSNPDNQDRLQQQQEEERGGTLLDTESATAAVTATTAVESTSSPPSQVQRSDSSGVPILEAYLVEDPEELPPGPVYDAETDAIYTAEATTILPWYKETRTKIFAAIVVVLVIVVSIVLGIVIPRLLVPPEDEIPPTVCFQDRTELLNATNRYITSGCGEEKTKCAEGDVELYGWPIGEWCVDNVTDMSNLFYNRDTFDEDISQWDVSNVVDMSWMFYGAQSFAQNLSSWNVTNVKSMFRMFDGAISFNSDIGSWAISNETRTNSMFFRASSFNQDLCEWGDSFAYDSSNSIFLQSGCTYQESPRENDRGPFCGSKCGLLQASTEPSISQSPTVSKKPSLRPSVNPPPTTFGSTPGATNEPTISSAPTSTRYPSLEPSRSSSPTVTCIVLNIDITYDEYPSEVSWDIARANKGDGTYSSIKSYQETRDAGEEVLTYSDAVCLQPGTFRFTISDSAGDGICCSYGQGSYNLTNNRGEIVVTGRDYGAGEATTFDWPMFASTVNTTGVLLN